MKMPLWLVAGLLLTGVIVGAVPASGMPQRDPVTLNCHDHIIDAAFPPPAGFTRIFENQRFDSVVMVGNRIRRASLYAADFEGMHGMLMYVDNPRIDVLGLEWTGHKYGKVIPLQVMEQTADYKIVYVNYVYSGPSFHKVLFVLTGPPDTKPFKFIIGGIPEDPV